MSKLNPKNQAKQKKQECYGLYPEELEALSQLNVEPRNIHDGPFMYAKKATIRSFEKLYLAYEARGYKPPVSRCYLQSVYYALCLIASDRTEQKLQSFSASYADIANKSAITKRTVIKAVAMLEFLKFIRVDHFECRKSQFTLTNLGFTSKKGRNEAT